MLVSHGARNFAENCDVSCVPTDSMVSERARRDWELWKSRLDVLASQSGHSLSEYKASGLHAIQDTVGAVVWDAAASLSAGVSRQGRVSCDPSVPR